MGRKQQREKKKRQMWSHASGFQHSGPLALSHNFVDNQFLYTFCFSGFKHTEKMYQTAEKLNPGPTCHRNEV